MDLGEVYIVLGVPTDKKAGFLTADEAAAMHTPFSAIGMHFLALTALVHSAEEFGYAEEHGDIGHRLAEGSERRYIKPLCTHIFQRLGLAQAQILSKITTALPSTMKIDKTMKSLLSQLLTKSAYIFPLKEGTTDKYLTSKLYQSDMILESLKIGFSTLDAIRSASLYLCPNTDFAQERKLPPQMVAVAATTVCAILQNLLYNGSGCVTDFVTPVLQSIYQAHMLRLLEWRRRAPRLYHKYMHLQYKMIIGIGVGVIGEQTTKEIINKVDWDNILDSEEEAAEEEVAEEEEEAAKEPADGGEENDE